MTRVSSTLLWIEAVICFGPLALVLLLGALMFPVWIAMLAVALSNAVVGVPVLDAGGGGSPWPVVAPMSFVVSGLVGLAGLFRVLLALTQHEHPRPSAGTAVMVLVGLVGLVALNLYDTPSSTAALLVYVLLPGIGSLHFIYLARAILLPRRD